MFENFKSFTIEVQSDPPVTIFGKKSHLQMSKSLPPLLLLHGFPQSYHCWHKVVPSLTDNYSVVVIDLRGYGASSKPEPISQYAKSLMARDCAIVMSNLGFKSFFVCAHDRGARVAHKLCVDYPEGVRKTILLDIAPTLDMYSTTSLAMAKAYYHWFFLIQKEPFPETLIASNARLVAEVFLTGHGGGEVERFDKNCLDYYINRLQDKECIHAMCQEYRASASIDLDEARKDQEIGKKIECPLQILWSKHGLLEEHYNPLSLWRALVKDQEAGYKWLLLRI
ncbi:hypothetical protein FOXB_02877 [Fusarium oxysporum f. sp. conglutinans Fo5176]|uniref:AB hydrolase-1 domain-containing protein n=1 Tax=Fusarium oxysporum (strain Fo5176) TaxID=660025 RepID=F9F902_FUSOF|nr:hypothetical protein FOXB_02877 [Fusarium oxysporum f. sp. conglutinans Fo5176]